MRDRITTICTTILIIVWIIASAFASPGVCTP